MMTRMILLMIQVEEYEDVDDEDDDDDDDKNDEGEPHLTRLSGAISVTGHISRVLVLFHLDHQ